MENKVIGYCVKSEQDIIYLNKQYDIGVSDNYLINILKNHGHVHMFDDGKYCSNRSISCKVCNNKCEITRNINHKGVYGRENKLRRILK